jgi:hypothetical protein
LGPGGIGVRGRGETAGFEPIVRKQIEIAFVTLAQQTLLPSTIAISSSFNRQTQRHSPLAVSKCRLRIVSSNINNHVSAVTTNDEAGVF